jgi:hypothetical protein
MAIDEAGNDGHLLGVVGLGGFPNEAFDFRGAADGDEAAGFDGEGLCWGKVGVDGVDFGVEDDEINIGLDFGGVGGSLRTGGGEASETEGGGSEKFSAVKGVIGHVV